MANLSADTNAVLKINLGENGTRRITLNKLWDDSTSTVSYQRLVNFCSDVSQEDVNANSAASVAVTYLDEDGDEITISTDSELAEAFEQFVDKIPPVLRATAVVQPGRKASPSKPRNAPSMEAKLEHFQTLRDSITEIRNSAKFKAEQFKNTTPKERMEHVTNVLDSIIMVLGQALEALSKNVEQVRNPASKRQMNINRQNQGRPCGRPNVNGQRDGGRTQARPCGRPNQAGPRGRHGSGPNVRRTEAEKKKISQKVMKKVLADVIGKEKAIADIIEKERKQKSVVTEGFIHGRHTCDGCLVTPIIGIRHHATNVPDYDLCSKCFPNYKGREIVFAPEELDRDRHLQQRWKRRQERQARQSKANEEKSTRKGEQNKSIIQSMDAALKEAIRRSLEESFPQKEDLVEKKTEKKEVVVDQVKATAPPSDEVEKLLVEEKMVSNTPSDIVSKQTSEENKSEDSIQEVDDESISKMTEDLKLDVNDDAEESHSSSSTEETKSGVKDEKAHSKDHSRDFSFTEGAEDEVAVAIGTTLDKCADAIDALGLSSSSSVSSSFTEVSAQKSDSNDGEILPAIDDDIVTSSSDAVSVRSEDDWQCVENENDDFAKAAHLLGSAMFQSDIASPSGELGESFTSGLTSVPTLTSEISHVLLTRWENELRQLHELGFLDDHVNVNALEHLEAANIGCGAALDEITVNAAVEHILKK